MDQKFSKDLLELSNLIKDFYGLLAHSGEQRTLSVMYESQLTLPQIVTLHYVSKCGACSISSISERIGLTLGATSHLVDRLVRKGYLSRHENPKDRRIKLIEITGKGNEFLSKLNESRTADLVSALSVLDNELVIKLRDILINATDKFRKAKGEKLCQK